MRLPLAPPRAALAATDALSPRRLLGTHLTRTAHTATPFAHHTHTTHIHSPAHTTHTHFTYTPFGFGWFGSLHRLTHLHCHLPARVNAAAPVDKGTAAARILAPPAHLFALSSVPARAALPCISLPLAWTPRGAPVLLKTARVPTAAVCGCAYRRRCLIIRCASPHGYSTLLRTQRVTTCLIGCNLSNTVSPYASIAPATISVRGARLNVKQSTLRALALRLWARRLCGSARRGSLKQHSPSSSSAHRAACRATLRAGYLDFTHAPLHTPHTAACTAHTLPHALHRACALPHARAAFRYTRTVCWLRTPHAPATFTCTLLHCCTAFVRSGSGLPATPPVPRALTFVHAHSRARVHRAARMAAATFAAAFHCYTRVRISRAPLHACVCVAHTAPLRLCLPHALLTRITACIFTSRTLLTFAYCCHAVPVTSSWFCAYNDISMPARRRACQRTACTACSPHACRCRCLPHLPRTHLPFSYAPFAPAPAHAAHSACTAAYARALLTAQQRARRACRLNAAPS